MIWLSQIFGVVLQRRKERGSYRAIDRAEAAVGSRLGASDPRRSSWAFASVREASRLWSLSCSLHNLSSPSAIKQFYKSHLATLPHVYFGQALSLTVYIHRARNATISRRKYPSSIDPHTHTSCRTHHQRRALARPAVRPAQHSS
jgi:hypothetical protein